MRKLLLAVALLLPGPPPSAPLPHVLFREGQTAVGAIMPRISPDGSAIAFSLQGALWRVDREGGIMRRLTSGPGFDTAPAWSPDGKRLAYFNGWGGPLRIVDAALGASLEAPKNANGQGKLIFHPDGKRILGNFPSLAWLDLETGGTKPLLDPPRAVPVFALSPDGTQVLIARSQDVPGEQDGHNGPQMDLSIVSSPGAAPRRLVQFRSRVYDLWWGKEIFLSSDLGGAHNDLWSLSVDDPGHAHRLTNGGADEDAPSASADGRWLVHTDNRGGATALVVRDQESGESRDVRMLGASYGRRTGILRVRVVDQATGRRVCGRVSVQEQGGRSYAPIGALYRTAGSVEHFYADGDAELVVPGGKYVVRAFRGLEYAPFRQEVEVPEGGTVAIPVPLARWADPASRGWRSGESHIHANYGYGHWYSTPETMRQQVQGEGLEISNFVVANSDTDGIFDREFFRGEPDPESSKEHVLYWNQEFRATLWGHLTLYNLKRLVEPVMTGFKDTTNPHDVPTNADIADHVHLQGGHVNYTHAARNVQDPYSNAYSAKSLPVDVALGKIDSLDINAEFEATVPLWYRLLNCGFRLPASAGTDCFLNRIRSRLPGSDRAYVKLDGPLSYDAWVQGLKAGRSFVTNGPLLELEVAGQGLGGTVRLDAPGKVAVRASARSASPLASLELVQNGRVLAAGTLSDDKLSGTLEQEVEIGHGGWLSLRAFADRKQAHTSPVYVELGGKGWTSRDDAEYFLKWIDRLDAQLKARDRVPSPALKAHVDAQMNAAREVYRALGK
jgi:hypothetical protein